MDLKVESAPGTDGPVTQSLQLIRLAQDGDREALGRLVERFQVRLHLIVRARLGPTLRGYLDSGDILQETWVAALKAFDRFDARDEGSLLHWLSRLAENQIRQAADHHHALKRDRRRERPLHDAATASEDPTGGQAEGEPAGAGPRPSSQAAQSEELQSVLDVLDRLTPEQREVFVLRHLAHGAPRWESIARDVGATSADAARQLYSRAVAAILRALRRQPTLPAGAPEPIVMPPDRT